MYRNKYHENIDVLQVNAAPRRSYYIPCANEREALTLERENSSRFLTLNGEWRFRYYENIGKIDAGFEKPGFDSSGFATVPVPSVWQTHGYDRHQYVNIHYPFPCDPPRIPYENPCGVYLRDFTLTDCEDLTYLNFEGVDSCYYVWINGDFVGYSQVSHVTGEFDVTPYVRRGGNTIAVLVFKWCDGSYLEAQDKFRMSGIFRDVYLLRRPKGHIADYTVKTTLTGGDKAAADVFADCDFDYTLLHRGEVIATGASAGGRASVEIPEPRLWSAEQPSLYTLLLSRGGEVIAEEVGIREVQIRDGVFYLNGVNIKFRGVNRHDFDPERGFTVSAEQMKRELFMMKRYNINAIRTSHYPNAPEFYKLCDRIGFYVLDEADVEAHGVCERYSKQTYEDRMAYIARMPLFERPILDRVSRMVIRDKNRPCVLIWSMGNESGYGVCFETALQWVKSYDGTRPTHYESAVCYERVAGETPDFSNLDLYSRMYPPIDEMEAFLNSGYPKHDCDRKKPYILCEYAHAMGNGGGDAEEYHKIFHKYEQCCGGFVWQWRDHGIAMGKA
ncbi:MAG: beta-galactosidase, partial [Clostridiales bacterium]|nr:beta-galactosidase [Clostridiales bacterium]